MTKHAEAISGLHPAPHMRAPQRQQDGKYLTRTAQAPRTEGCNQGPINIAWGPRRGVFQTGTHLLLEASLHMHLLQLLCVVTPRLFKVQISQDPGLATLEKSRKHPTWPGISYYPDYLEPSMSPWQISDSHQAYGFGGAQETVTGQTILFPDSACPQPNPWHPGCQ